MLNEVMLGNNCSALLCQAQGWGVKKCDLKRASGVSAKQMPSIKIWAVIEF